MTRDLEALSDKFGFLPPLNGIGNFGLSEWSVIAHPRFTEPTFARLWRSLDRYTSLGIHPCASVD